MFRVVEGPLGVTHIYRAATNQLVCSVKEKAAAPSSAFTSSRLSSSPRRCAPDANNHKLLQPVNQERFLALLELQPISGACGPRAVVERLPADCNSGEWPGAQAAVQAYSRYCVSRVRIASASPAPFPVVYRPMRHRSYLGHIYSFSKRERWKRLRELRLGLSRRALALLDKCGDVRVRLRRLTPAEVALWTKGHTRLGRTPLRELPSFLRPVRCVLSNVVLQHGSPKSAAKWTKCVCAAYGRQCVCAVSFDGRASVCCMPPSSSLY